MEKPRTSRRSRSTAWGTTGWSRDATAYTPLRFPGQYADPETGLHYNFRGDATSGFGGSVRYGRLDHLGRPTGVYAQIRPEMLNTGTEAGSVRTPGWRGNGNDFNEARGHLYANRLGGHAKGKFAWQNLVTETPTNTPEQRVQVEAVIHDQVKNNDEIVRYNVVPKYAGSNPVPHEIHFTADGNKGFTFTYLLENPAAYVRTGV
ncbi:DNA/RNA non-specific endonuclease [Streptomyces tanashiensis]